MIRKKPFSSIKNVSICRKFFLTALESLSFFKQKAFSLHKPLLAVLKCQPVQTKSFLFAQALPDCLKKQPLFATNTANFHPAITYCPQKNTAILLPSALNPYAVTPEPHTDSKPFRRRFVRKAGFGSCRWKLLQKYFRQSFESRSQDGVDSLKHGRLAHVRSQFSLFRRSPTHKNLPPATFCTSEHVLFGYFLHNAKSDNPFPCRELRGSTNLESAHPNNNFPLTKLNPSPKGASRFCKPRSSAQIQQLRTSPLLKSFCRSAAFPPPLAAPLAASRQRCSLRELFHTFC